MANKDKVAVSHEDYARSIGELERKLDACDFDKVFGIPRGGQYPAGMIAQDMGKSLVFDPAQIDARTLIVDDLCDSGRTIEKFHEEHHGSPCAVVYLKQGGKRFDWLVSGETIDGGWLVFPDEHDGGIEEVFQRTLEFIGEDTTREGLVETPSRMRRAYEEIFAGYRTDPKTLVKTFVKGTCKEMVVLKHAEFYSTCEHHFFPFFGHCSIGYIPNGKVIGVSKLARLLDCYSRRMQIQERMTTQIADFLMDELQALGVYVVCEGVHFCMTSRGVRKHDASMVTSAVRGVFEHSPQARAEFLSLIKA